MDIEVREADEADLGFVVWAMVTAATSHLSRCVWSTLADLDGPATEALLAEVARSPAPHWCHLDRFLVAERAGVPVGALTRFDPAIEGTAALTDVVLAAVGRRGVDGPQLEALVARALLLDAATPPDLPEAWGIENVAVHPAHRGVGVVDRLLETALDEGRRNGCPRVQILCLDGNMRAQRTWERHGFLVVDQRRDEGFEATFGSAGLTLLAQDL